MFDETSKKDVKLTDTTEDILTKLLNADSSDIDKYNAGKTGKYSLTTLASYSGDIPLNISVGIPEGSIFSLITQEENLGPVINLKLLSIDEKQYKNNLDIINKLKKRNVDILSEGMLSFEGDTYE